MKICPRDTRLNSNALFVKWTETTMVNVKTHETWVNRGAKKGARKRGLPQHKTIGESHEEHY